MTWLRHILVGTLRQKVIKGILLDLAQTLDFAQGLKMHGECNRKIETCTSLLNTQTNEFHSALNQ